MTTILEKDPNNSNYFPASKKRLEARFPPKFLSMWANKDKVLHPFSLMVFRSFFKSKCIANLLNKEEIAKILDPKEKDCADALKKFLKDNNLSELPKLLTDMKFDCFTKVWKYISNAILEKLNKLRVNLPVNFPKLSKLISILIV